MWQYVVQVVDSVCAVPTVRSRLDWPLTSHAIVGEPFTEFIPHNEEHREWKGSQLAELLLYAKYRYMYHNTLRLQFREGMNKLSCSKVQYQNVIGLFTTYEHYSQNNIV
jgi:hypothetical protein